MDFTNKEVELIRKMAASFVLRSESYYSRQECWDMIKKIHDHLEKDREINEKEFTQFMPKDEEDDEKTFVRFKQKW